MSLLYLGVGPNSFVSSSCMFLDKRTLLKPWLNSRVKLNHRINHYPLDNAIDFSNTYLMDSESSMESAIHLLTAARPLSKNNAINAIRRLERKQKNSPKAVEFAYYSFFFIYLELKR